MSKRIKKENANDIIIFLIPFIIFTILFFAYYPGIITYDGNNQWQQVQNGIINNGHPFFSTFFMLMLSKIYNSTSIILFYQITVFSLLWSYICKHTRKKKSDFIIQIIFTVMLSCIPIISIYSITLWKDVLYSYYLVGIAYVFYVGIDKNFKYNKFEIVLLSLLLFLVFSYRHNGMIVSILLIMFIIILFKRSMVNRKSIMIVLVCFVGFNTIVYFPKHSYIEAAEEEKETKSIGTIDSYIFWMYSAHLNDENINSDKDLEFLNNIMDIELWKNKYNPYLINSTNMLTKDEEYIIENNSEYRNLFIETTINNPTTIIRHYLRCTALLWSPYEQGYVYVYDFSDWNYPYDFSSESKLPIVRKVYNKIINFTFIEPIDTIFHRPANLMYLSIILTIILSISLKNRKIYIILLPMLANTLSLIPISLAQDLRYVYINYLTFFFVLYLVVLNYRNIFNYFKRKVK